MGEGDSWQLVKHPVRLPGEFTDGGETCLMLDLKTDAEISMKGDGKLGKFASLSQSYYPVLDPKKTYVVESWAATDRVTPNASATFEFRQNQYRGENSVKADFQLQPRWTHHNSESSHYSRSIWYQMLR